jgi:transposase
MNMPSGWSAGPGGTIALTSPSIATKHCYSVPHQRPKTALWVRRAARTVAVFRDGQRLASHVRTSGNRRHTTVTDPMPASHRRHAGITPDEIRRRAARVGANTARLVDLILHTKTHPEQGLRAGLGIVRLLRPHGSAAVEAACGRAAEIGARSYSSVLSIPKNNRHRRRPPKPAAGPAIIHPNIRGASYGH